MKKLIFFLIATTILNNTSYASFPSDTNKTDTTKIIVKETIEQYHQRMEQQGFDILTCMCEDCRKFKGHNEESVSLSPKEKSKINIMFLVSAFLILLVTLSIYIDLDYIVYILPIILTIFLIFYLRIILIKMKAESK